MLDWKFLNGKFFIDGTEVTPDIVRKKDDLKEVLLDPSSVGEEIVYLAFRNLPDLDKPEGMRADITIVFQELLGREYAKTHGHYHLGEGVEYYRLLKGTGLTIMQKPGPNFESIEAVRIVRLVPGQDIQIPSGWGHTIVNTGEGVLVTENFENPEIKQFYTPYADKHGAAYYVVADEGGVKYLANENYGEVPKPQTF
jgi:glucose-6-phosphate isomerase